MAELKNAAEDVKFLCETILHFDAEGLQKYNYTMEDLTKMWTDSFIKAMQGGAQNIFTQGQAIRIGNAMISALQKVAIEVNSLDDAGKVEVMIRGLDFAKGFSEKNLQLDVDEGVSRAELVSSFVRAIANRFESLEPTRTTVFVVECKYYEQDNSWIPINMENFFSELMASATGGK